MVLNIGPAVAGQAEQLVPFVYRMIKNTAASVDERNIQFQRPSLIQTVNAAQGQVVGFEIDIQ